MERDEIKDIEENMHPDILLFIAKWFSNGRNGTNAYLHVHPGLKEKSAATSASRLLKNVKVKKVIAHRLQEIAASSMVTAVWALNKRIKIVERCMQAEEVMQYDPSLKGMVGTGEYVFDSSGANKALDAIEIRHLGLAERRTVENTGKDGEALQATTVINVTGDVIKNQVQKLQDEF